MSELRQVTVALCRADGSPVGQTPEFPVADPWWPQSAPVIDELLARFGISATLLRLVGHDGAAPNGGRVRYLAELTGPAPEGLRPVSDLDELLRPEPLRAPWAEPGGVDQIVGWVDDRLASVGRRRTAPVRLLKSWNLSMVLEVPTDAGTAWCKAVPEFFAHEGEIIALLAVDHPDLVPRLIAHRPGLALMADVSGEDQYDAPEPVLERMVAAWAGVQAQWIGRTAELAAAGLPSWSAAELTALAGDLAGRRETRDALGSDGAGAVDKLIASLPQRFKALEACGIPDTLVHGDFHPGNWRADGDALVLMDWGDSGIGHPMLDMPAFLQWLPVDRVEPARDMWISRWQEVRPGCDAAGAATLIRPIAALRQAVIYQHFLDGIEPDERVYHCDDVPLWLRTAVAEAEAVDR